MHHYADVAVPLGVDRTFTYLIPPELQSSVAVGVRVIVPLGRRYTTGLVVGLPASTPRTSLKPLRDVLDAAPVVGDELLKLCTWIADYYFAPIGEVFKSAIPHGFSAASKRVASLALTGEELRKVLNESVRQAPKRAHLLSLLAEHGPLPASELQKKVGLKNINAVLNDLARTGAVRVEEVLPETRKKSKTKDFVLLGTLDPARIEKTIADLPRRKKNARRLLMQLLRLKAAGQNEVSVTDVLKEAGAGPATLKELAASGLVSVARRPVTSQQEFGTEQKTLDISLNPAQQAVLHRIRAGIDGATHKTLLLHGVTGSGKTQVYIEAIRHCLNSRKTAIVLVPEIALTPQIVRRFKSHFADAVAVVHSQMSLGDRQEVWRLALQGHSRVVIGPRSAIFAPLQNLGLIVVDEEHEASYKQYDATPRYHARDVAVVRAKLNNAVAVLGSATPSVESFHNAQSGKYELLEMPERIDRVPMPPIGIVDMTAQAKTEYAAAKESLPRDQRTRLREFQQSSISPSLRSAIEDRLKKKEGIILLQNRRGFAPFVECPECGHTEMCDRCSITMTYHQAKQHIRCHYCGTVRKPPIVCAGCGSPNIQLKGIGTQRVEEELATLFPSARLLRMDLDTTSRKGAHDRILRKFGDAEADILLGTQMVAKGLDFARVTLVGVVSADTQMLLPDFRSSERTFQLLTQVAGRAGRSTLQGEVIIQTHQPKHYTLQHVVAHDFRSYYEVELATREELAYPPFSRLVLIETRGKNENDVKREAERVVGLLKSVEHSFTVLGPAPAVISKVKNYYRWHIILKAIRSKDATGSKLRQVLRQAFTAFQQKQKNSVRLTIDVDPVGLM